MVSVDQEFGRVSAGWFWLGYLMRLLSDGGWCSRGLAKHLSLFMWSQDLTWCLSAGLV